MNWRRLALALIALCAIGCTWMYLRDRPSSARPRSGWAAAQFDANRMLTLLATMPGCDGGCGIEALNEVSPHFWRVQLNARSWRRCFVLDLQVFTYSEAHGIAGVTSTPCR
jgi:hypothetical protein